MGTVSQLAGVVQLPSVPPPSHLYAAASLITGAIKRLGIAHTDNERIRREAIFIRIFNPILRKLRNQGRDEHNSSKMESQQENSTGVSSVNPNPNRCVLVRGSFPARLNYHSGKF